MFAVFESGGKQHRVSHGERIRLERLDAEPGAEIEFDRVLMVGDGEQVTIGEPFVDGGKVKAEVIGHDRYRKIRIIKFRRRRNSMTRTGHRQWYTEVRITGISG